MLRGKRLVSFVMSIVMVIVLAACSGNNEKAANSGSASNAGGKESAGSADSGAVDTSKFVKVSYVVLGDKPKNGQFDKTLEKVNKLMKEKINAELEWKWVEWADWSTKYNLLLASGEPIDLITVATDWLDTWNNAQRGAFTPLDELLPKYAPQTWESIPQEDWAQTKYKDQIMLIPENDYTQWVNHGFFYRGDWAKEAGITSPIIDFETLGKYFQYVKESKPDVIPWDAQSSGNIAPYLGFTTSYTDMIELPIGTGYMPAFFAKSFDEKYTVDSPIFNDVFLNMAKMMKDWADKGYWREDVLNYKGDTRTLLKAGLSGADAHHTQTFGSLRVLMDEEQPGSELAMFPFSATRKNLIELSITHGGTSLGAHSKNPERALMAYELMRNDKEIYQLINFGMEGVQYELKDGKRVKPAGYDQKRDEFYSDFWGGRVDKFEIPTDTVWDGVTQYYADYDTYKKPYPYGQFVFDKSSIDAELTAISQVTGEMGPAILFGKAGDPVKAVEDFRNKLKAAGYDKVLAEIQKQMDAYKTLIEG
ncbi:ABC transporter substrate-binding protein [Cohnella sp.]|uniref:ABC transporter substrate-binding protein n=1 Tax=Cohnella sp. TaxID=1883426 RepID=UPI003567E2DB